MTKIPELNEMDKLIFHNIHAFDDYREDLYNYLQSETLILGGDILEHNENGYSHCDGLNWYYNGYDYIRSNKVALDYFKFIESLSLKKELYIEYVIVDKLRYMCFKK